MKASPEFLFIYITCASKEEADKIGLAAVEQKLAACANITPGMHSLYPWKGKIERAEEAVLILKSRAVHFEKLEALVTSLHSAETPCIAALPVMAMNAGYASWVRNETP